MSKRKRFKWDELGLFDKFFVVVFVIATPWNWLLAVGAWMSTRDHMCDIEEKLDELKKETKLNPEIHTCYIPYHVDAHGISRVFDKDTISY